MKPKKIESFECYLCHIQLKSKLSNLRRHIKLHGPNIKLFKCAVCKKGYQTKSNLRVHWNDKHRDQQEQQQFKFETEYHSSKRKLNFIILYCYYCYYRYCKALLYISIP